LVRDSRALASAQWDGGLAQRTQEAFERLADHAANMDIDPIRLAALDLYVYLAAFDSDDSPQPGQLAEIDRLALALDASLTPYRPESVSKSRRVAAPELVDAPAESQLCAWLGATDPPTQLVHDFAQRGIGMLHIPDLDALADALKPVLPVAIITSFEHVAALCEHLDGVARRLPASANMVVVGYGSGNAEDRLHALLGGSEVFVERLDDPNLVTRVVELAEPPDTPFRVLLVDDDASTRMYLRAVLQQAGMTVSTTGDPNEVENEIATFKPDLLLVDLFMPDTDGMTLTMRLRERAELRVLPIVFLSGEQGDKVRRQAIRAGGDDYLTKPVKPRSLVAAVRTRIQRARSLRRQLSSTVVSSARSGRLRRGDFLAAVADSLAPVPGRWRVLLAIKVDQADALRTKLGQAGAYELEQSIDLRLTDVLEASDVFALWQEFGFGMLIERGSREALLELGTRLTKAVAERPFKVQGQDTRLTISVGIALPPSGDAAAVTADRWIASAFAAQAVAHRLGGNRFDGVLDAEAGALPAERVLMIREAVKQASTTLNLMIEFQPMVRLHGEHDDQYALIAKLRDFRAPLAGVRREEYLEAARSAGALSAIDRTSLFRAFEAIEEQRSRGRSTRVAVAVDLASFDHTQLVWLEAELRRRSTHAPGLTIEFDAALLLERPALKGILRRLCSFDIGLGIHDRSGSLMRIPQYLELPLTMLRIPHSAIASLSADAFADMLSSWREAGRSVIVDAVDDVASVSRLWAFGVDYLQGNALAASGPRLDYEAAQVHTE
jgi:CheY-like chemotaxis protein/EAL domain-containing protein (putative c-di-GMP-specific phosphodiesterase class I)